MWRRRAHPEQQAEWARLQSDASTCSRDYGHIVTCSQAKSLTLLAVLCSASGAGAEDEGPGRCCADPRAAGRVCTAAGRSPLEHADIPKAEI